MNLENQIIKCANSELIEKWVRVKLPTAYWDFEMVAFKQLSNWLEHVALIKWEWKKDEPVLIRVHSSCVTWDIFWSCRCDCWPQLHEAMRQVDKNWVWVILYLNQEWRWIWLLNKMKAYKLQENWYDTVQANIELWFKDDERDYTIWAEILKNIWITKINLLTNNPSKRYNLTSFWLEILKTVPIELPTNEHNHFYMKTKKDKMGHELKSI